MISVISKVVNAVRFGRWRPVRKLVAVTLSGLTASGVVAYGDAFGFDVSQGVAALIVTGATALAGYLMPDRKRRP